VSVPITAQVASVARELKLRRRVYPRRVAEQKMTQQFANDEIEAMQAVLATLQSIAEKERLL
jgi:hypothetical protein